MTKTKILVVDDESAVTRMVQRALERTERFEVRMVNQGSLALNSAREFQPDLVFLDVMMPGIQGDEIAHAMKKDPVLRDTPCIFLTAMVTREETAATGGRIGGQLYLAKPVKAQALLDMIESVLGQ